MRVVRAVISAVVVVLVALPSAASAASDPHVRYVRVSGQAEWLAVDGGAAFVLRRGSRSSEVVRIDLATGRRTVAFRTTGFPQDEAHAAGGVLAFGLTIPGDPEHTQAIAIPTSVGGKAVVLRDAVWSDAGDVPCSQLLVDDVTPAGEVLLSTFSSPCDRPKAGTETVSLVAPGGERTILTTPTEIDAVPLGNPASPTLAAGSWAVVPDDDQHLRLIDTSTGSTHPFSPTLAHARLIASDLQPDGRFVLSEILFRRRGGYVQRARLMAPTDPRRGGRVLGTLGTPSRLNAALCGGRLVILRTKARRTHVLVGGKEVARVSTPGDPRFACDARHMVVEAGGAATRYGVLRLLQPS